MTGTFSVEDLLDPFWQTNSGETQSPMMDRSASEWELQRYLQEGFPPSGPAAPDPSPQLVGPADDPEECRALLKSKLHMACAAAAKSLAAWSSGTKPEGGGCCSSSSSSLLAEDHSEAATDTRSGQLLGQGAAFGASQVKSGLQLDADGTASSLPALPTTRRKQGDQVRQTTSGSSREDSDDDELEGDTGTNEHVDPADVKRARRMQSNRESARRSRRRKQEQLNDLESQVGDLREERASLLSRFTDINQKCDEAAVDNRILKADIETLRAKVKMAEEQVKRVTGINPGVLGRSTMPDMGPQFVGAQVDAPSDFAVPMSPNSNPFLHQTIPNFNPSHLQAINNFTDCSLLPYASNGRHDSANMAHVMTSVQLPPSGKNLVDKPFVQNVQKPIDPAANGDGTLATSDPGAARSAANGSKK